MKKINKIKNNRVLFSKIEYNVSCIPVNLSRIQILENRTYLFYNNE